MHLVRDEIAKHLLYYNWFSRMLFLLRLMTSVTKV